MPSVLSLLFHLLPWFWFYQRVRASNSIVNVTIDDTHQSIVYFPAHSWIDQGSSVSDVQLDVDLVFNRTWHGCMFIRPNTGGNAGLEDSPCCAVLSFHGVAVYVYGIVNHGGPYQDIGFFIDNNPVGNFIHSPRFDILTDYDYGVLYYSNTRLTSTNHTLTIVNGVHDGNTSFIALDRVIYSDIVPVSGLPPPSSSIGPTTSITTPSTPTITQRLPTTTTVRPLLNTTTLVSINTISTPESTTTSDASKGHSSKVVLYAILGSSSGILILLGVLAIICYRRLEAKRFGNAGRASFHTRLRSGVNTLGRTPSEFFDSEDVDGVNNPRAAVSESALLNDQLEIPLVPNRFRYGVEVGPLESARLDWAVASDSGRSRFEDSPPQYYL